MKEQAKETWIGAATRAAVQRKGRDFQTLAEAALAPPKLTLPPIEFKPLKLDWDEAVCKKVQEAGIVAVTKFQEVTAAAKAMAISSVQGIMDVYREHRTREDIEEVKHRDMMCNTVYVGTYKKALHRQARKMQMLEVKARSYGKTASIIESAARREAEAAVLLMDALTKLRNYEPHPTELTDRISDYLINNV